MSRYAVFIDGRYFKKERCLGSTGLWRVIEGLHVR